MFKKYTKNLLGKEVTSSQMTSPLATQAFFSTPIPGRSLQESTNEQHETNFSPDEPETTIGKEVSITGTLTFAACLRIDGAFEGELISDGKLIIGPEGYVKANINLEEAFISGKVDGDITVRGKLTLRGRAQIRGNIRAASLSVDEGVSIIGLLKVETPKGSEDLDEEGLPF
jgi:cytoskeletal protein CcmA (bactofilin family)